MKMNRRAFIKTCGIMTGYAVLGLNLAKEAAADVMDFVGLRQKSVYATDANPKIYKLRKSQDNPMIKKLYDHKDGFLHDGPCGHMSHHLLHTHYIDRSAKAAALKSKGFKLNF
ncbi:MAG: iron hydrogenase small subunit [Pseudodesulfovibrio sp.]|uniref:Iron hydrogenase small subunit n=1 Tax=Pseudodesulfovibrio aespoeensis (strain ATCC 700646 / DSM 10631 / Aspo-2) TaxID=643562 RepID=E6VWC1_PSEA9|nr:MULTISPECIES: iron hydrogenase small subunit [Pseudodesulfovibrio]MBU4476501.1 iron hydrogenase small subunit [Pseudomonadota bacterium]ADU61327.1 iron hydrogenase small subunit [Pseudodesulfovibrio aespoeensis Aspo-2]ADU61616.1 iron hydrogenase small subunit [Pseudodesulfovibrio aespoeensis Aspo-2]MBV1766645.1 iron hydrogenase small subunit [Pseudodesulfovibrio sp.]MBV1771413.1 iron hydrogenase small subunit [Pseudodesulfovibrio sp.]